MRLRLGGSPLRKPHRPWAAAVAAAVAVLILTPGLAAARDIPSSGLTLNDVVAWLQGGGFPAQIMTGNDGSQHVSSTIDGTKFGVYMFDCTAGRCGSIQFSAGFSTHGKFDTTRMNQWNRDKRWCRGYFDSDNDPWIEMDVDLTPGGTYELLDDELATYRKMLKIFIGLYDLK